MDISQRAILILGALFQSHLFGQTLAGVGYDAPNALPVAPGQVVSLFVTGMRTGLSTRQQATTLPLPTTLAGISVTVNQSPAGTTIQLPVFAIQQFSRCPSVVQSSCLITAITVQMPYELAVPGPLAIFAGVQTTTLSITEGNVVSSSFAVAPVSDQIHVLTSCDIGGTTVNTGVCVPLVTHADGSLVLQDISSPGQSGVTHTAATAGEVLVMYAYGLGGVASPPTLGTPAPNELVPVAEPIYIQYDYRPNQSPTMPTFSGSPSGTPARPIFAGLAPGQIGLYQVNFTVPPVPDGTPLCGGKIQSNLTVSVTSATGFSFGGAGICVDQSSPAPGAMGYAHPAVVHGMHANPDRYKPDGRSDQ